MDSARDITTNEIIEAEQLWEIEFVDKERYRCIGCGTQLWPASYKRDINKKRPYFTLGVSSTHIEPCDIDGEEEVIKRAKSERLGTPDGFPLPYPNKLVLSDERPVVIQVGGQQTQSGGERRQTRGDGNSGQRANHGHTVKTIRPIAKAFMKYLHDREGSARVNVVVVSLTRTDTPDAKARAAGLPPKALLRADPDAGSITLDSETTLRGIPADAWLYKLGNRSALDWVLDQYKEKKPKDPTIREKFDTYRFADYKEKVIDLLMRVTTVSVETVRVTQAMQGVVRTN